MLPALCNIAIYQTVWAIAVIIGNRGLLPCCLLLLLHLFFSKKKIADILTMVTLLAIGMIVDGTLSHLGLFSFREPGPILPLWLMAIWLALGIMPNHSLAWMKQRPVLCCLFGAIGGPAAYWGGVRLDAAVFHWPLATSLLTLAVIWSLLWLLVIYCSIFFTRLTKKMSS